MYNAAYFIEHLQLQPHPEGGYYRQTYKSNESINADCLPGRFGNARYISTAIYYLLEQGDYSCFHKIKSDECWHFYAGETLQIHMLHNNGEYKSVFIGSALDKSENLQFVVPANTWFAAELAHNSSFVLAGCTVAPGFEFDDFEIASRENLLQQFPQHNEIIKKLTR